MITPSSIKKIGSGDTTKNTSTCEKDIPHPLFTSTHRSSTFFSCEKEETPHLSDTEFCSSLLEGDYDQLTPVLNHFFENQNQNDSEEQKMKRLANWLREKSCISNVEVLCVSCIQTNPLLSEIQVHISTGGKTVTKKLDIIMEFPLKLGAIHE